MKRLLIATAGAVSVGVAYWHWGYRPCIPVPPGLFTLTPTGFVPIPSRSCDGPTFDNLLLLIMSMGIGLAVIAQLGWTRYYSPRGLGILYLLTTFAGAYFRSTVLPRLFGFPPITFFEFALIRALITVGAPLFLIGTLRWYWGRIRRPDLKAYGLSQLLQDEPPDV